MGKILSHTLTIWGLISRRLLTDISIKSFLTAHAKKVRWRFSGSSFMIPCLAIHSRPQRAVFLLTRSDVGPGIGESSARVGGGMSGLVSPSLLAGYPLHASTNYEWLIINRTRQPEAAHGPMSHTERITEPPEKGDRKRASKPRLRDCRNCTKGGVGTRH